MLKNHLTVGLRNLLRHKGYNITNLAGLALGFAICILIFLFIRHEIGYDRFHERGDRIYRVVSDSYSPGSDVRRYATSSRHVAPILEADYPEVARAVRLYPWEWDFLNVTHEGRHIFGDEVLFADSAFFEVFTFSLVHGDPQRALREPFTAVITESMARKYFDSANVVGQTLTLNDSLAFTITGVAADVPPQSHVTFDMLASWATFDQFRPAHQWDWTNFWMHTYVLLERGASAADLEAKIGNLTMMHHGEQLGERGGRVDLALQPLSSVHLDSSRLMELTPTANRTYLYVFGIIAVLVLLIACINFMNLATARSLDRAKETGIRKAIGSTRRMLVCQFLTEATIFSMLALGLSLAIAWLALPHLNALVGKELSLQPLLDAGPLTGLLAAGLIVGLISGSYPALVLSRFEPIAVLRGGPLSGRDGVRMRQTLVVFQFAISVALIAGTLIVHAQLRYMQQRSLGFEPEQVLVVDAGHLPPMDVAQNYRSIKEALGAHSAIREVSAADHIPGIGGGAGDAMYPEGVAEGESRLMFNVSADHAYVESIGLEVVAGRDFSEAHGTDATEAALINESAVRNFGWGEAAAAIGKSVRAGSDWKMLRVVGVVEDYHHRSPHAAIEPILIRIRPGNFRHFLLRLDTDNVQRTVAGLESTWEQLFPGYPFEYFFLDDFYNRQYHGERRLGLIFGTFASLAILIGCLGLFGLVAYAADARKKEIGIRKVLGATVGSIVALLIREFAGLLMIAFAVGLPLAYLAMLRWLDDFAYRTTLSWWMFAAAAAAVIAVAFLTVGYRAVRTALMNPVRSLRYE